MSLKRKSVGGTPSGSRARQAFKSPFRSPDTSDVSSPLLDENASSTLIQQRTQKVENINKNLDNFAERCQETPDSSKKQTSHDSKLREASVSNSTPRRVVVGRSRQIIDSCRRKVIPRQFNVPFRSPSISPVSQQSVSQEQQLTQLYKQEALLKELEEYVVLDQFKGMGEQDTSPPARLFHLSMLPKRLQLMLIKEFNVDRRSRDLEDVLRAAAHDTDCADVIVKGIQDIVKTPSLTQSLKGLLTAGAVKSVKYSFSKLKKMWKSLQR